jgi:hypothetical protein
MTYDKEVIDAMLKAGAKLKEKIEIMNHNDMIDKDSLTGEDVKVKKPKAVKDDTIDKITGIREPWGEQTKKSIMKNEEEMCDRPKCRQKATMKNALSGGKMCEYHFNADSNRQPQRGLGMKHWVPIV